VHRLICKLLDQWFWTGGACNFMTYVELYTGLMALNEQLVILFCTAFSALAINKGCLKWKSHVCGDVVIVHGKV